MEVDLTPGHGRLWPEVPQPNRKGVIAVLKSGLVHANSDKRPSFRVLAFNGRGE